MSRRLDPAAVPPWRFLHFDSTNNGKNSDRTACDLAVFGSTNHRPARIPARNEMSLADNMRENSKNSDRLDRGRIAQGWL
jgi:hypothetical protein